MLVSVEVEPRLMREFADRLESEGWRVFRVELDAPNPAVLVNAAPKE